MGRYHFLAHTADEKFVVEADTLNDAFATCLDAFYEIIIPDQKVKEIYTKTITIEAKRLRSLLYDFLNELVFIFDDEDLLLRNIEELEIEEDGEEYRLTATLLGDKHYHHDVVTEIKSMTYSDMNIHVQPEEVADKNDDPNVKITVVVDI